ncbi:hypothetical protein BH23PAT1_BH23PAT1_4790 [soil metagenome]
MLVVPFSVFLGTEWLIVAASLMIIVISKRTAGVLLLTVSAGMLVGLHAGSVEQSKLSQYDQYLSQTVVLTGKVTDDTIRGPSGNQQLRLDNLKIDNQQLSGRVWVGLSSKADIKRGDIVVVKGRLAEGFGTSSASIYRASLLNAYRPEPGDVARKVRDRFSKGVRASVPEPEASLGISYLVGQRRSLPEALNEQLRILGLTHLVVASGFHLTILVRFARRVFLNISKYTATLASSVMIGGFLLLSGFSTSMTRAALVAGISLLAWYYGRNVHPIVLLLFVAAITVLINPAFIWGDIGWYLSFAAFTGVIILAPLMQEYFWGRSKEPGLFRQMLIATIAAQITTYPIVAYTFGQYSPLALAANLLILPLVPFAMLFTFLGGLMGLVAPGLAQIAGVPAYGLLSYMTNLTGWLSRTPWAYGEVTFGIEALSIGYPIVLFLMIHLWRKTNHKLYKDSAV